MRTVGPGIWGSSLQVIFATGLPPMRTIPLAAWRFVGSGQFTSVAACVKEDVIQNPKS